MAKRHRDESVLIKKPLPSTGVPWLVILCLLASLWLAHHFFFGAPDELLGGPPPKNEYIHYLQEPKAKPKPKPKPAPVQPAAPSPTPANTAGQQ